MKFVDKKDLFSKQFPIEEELPGDIHSECFQYDREVKALKHLTAANCSSAPKYIADLRLDEKNPWVKNGFFCFVVMTRVPGRPMSDVWPTAPRSPPDQIMVRVWEAFKDALL